MFVKMGAIRAIRGCPTRTIPNPDEGRMSGRPCCPPSSSFELRASSFLRAWVLRASCFSSRVGRLRRPTLRYASQPLRGTHPAPPPFELRRPSSFVLRHSFELRHSSFPPVVAKKEPSPTLPPRAPRMAANPTREAEGITIMSIPCGLAGGTRAWWPRGAPAAALFELRNLCAPPWGGTLKA